MGKYALVFTLKGDKMNKLPNIKNSLHVGYGILVSEVLLKLSSFKEDITKHDKRMLTGYQGDFISLFRESGTHLFKCNGVKDAANWAYKNPEESLRLTHEGCIAMVNTNQNYLFVSKDGKFKYISKGEVVCSMESRYERAIKFYKESFLKMNFEGMATIIEFTMSQFGKRWKSNLIGNWDSDYCSPEERRLRNHFGEKFLKTIKFKTEKTEIQKSLINHYMKDR